MYIRRDSLHSRWYYDLRWSASTRVWISGLPRWTSASTDSRLNMPAQMYLQYGLSPLIENLRPSRIDLPFLKVIPMHFPHLIDLVCTLILAWLLLGMFQRDRARNLISITAEKRVVSLSLSMPDLHRMWPRNWPRCRHLLKGTRFIGKELEKLVHVVRFSRKVGA